MKHAQIGVTVRTETLEKLRMLSKETGMTHSAIVEHLITKAKLTPTTVFKLQ